MRRSHAKAISEGQRKSWTKGGASRIAYEKRRRLNGKKTSRRSKKA